MLSKLTMSLAFALLVVLIINQYLCQHVPLNNRYNKKKRALLGVDEDDDKQNSMKIYVDGIYVSNFNGETTTDKLYEKVESINGY